MMDSPRNKYLQVFIGQVVLIVTFLISSLTTLTTIYIIFSLRLNNDIGIIRVDKISDNLSQLVVNQNLHIEKLVPSEEIQFESITSPTISISSRNSQNQNESPTSVLMNKDEILIRAEHFSTGSSRPLEFRIPRKLGSLRVPHGIHNMKLIRPFDAHANPSIRHRNSSKLEITSDSGLQLSGNLGLRAHSFQSQYSSRHLVEIDSREGSITLSAADGIYLPNLARSQPRKVDSRYMLDSDLHDWVNEDKIQLCMSRESGLIYQATRDSCR